MNFLNFIKEVMLAMAFFLFVIIGVIYFKTMFFEKQIPEEKKQIIRIERILVNAGLWPSDEKVPEHAKVDK